MGALEILFIIIIIIINGAVLDEVGHGGSGDQKWGWIATFAHSNLAFNLVTRHDLPRKHS